MLPLKSSFTTNLPDDAVELRAFTHGLMPATVPDMMQAFVEDWASRGVDAWNRIPNHWKDSDDPPIGWWSLPEYLADTFVAPAIGAPQGTSILQPNVHWTVQCLLSAPETFSEGSHVVLTEAEFPSVLHSLKQWRDLLELQLTIVPLDESGFVDQESVLDAITPDTDLVALSHVGFTTGEVLQDAFLQRVADKVHRHDGLLLVDGYHAVGSLPVDVVELNADLYTGGLLKEACGSSGNAFVYIRSDLELTPRTTGWFGDADPFAFASEPDVHPQVRYRFQGGTTAVASMYHAVEGLRILLDAGLDHVREYSLQLTERCITRADAAGLAVRSPREASRRGAMVILEVPMAGKLCAALKEHHIYTDSRQDKYLRMAPFVWNSEEEVDRAFDILSKLVSTGAYRSTPVSTTEEAGPVT